MARVRCTNGFWNSLHSVSIIFVKLHSTLAQRFAFVEKVLNFEDKEALDGAFIETATHSSDEEALLTAKVTKAKRRIPAASRSMQQSDLEPKSRPKPKPKSKAKPQVESRGSKRVASPDPPQSSRKQPKLASEGKGKGRERKSNKRPSRQETPPALEDIEADNLRRAMEESRITSRPGKVGSSSGMMERIESQSSNVSTEPHPPSTAPGLSSEASTAPQSDIDDVATNVPMTEISAGYSVPSQAILIIASQFSSEEDLGYYGSFLTSSDLPPNFVEAWQPVRSSWEACGIFFGTQDEAVRARSLATYDLLRPYVAQMLAGFAAGFSK